ncbi:MAG: ABC transporter permease [Bacteroidetes bacterium]|nr:ABC transporter permease [Bacteroidota bacterium]
MKRRSHRPPRVAQWILDRALHDVHADEVLGDVEETYNRIHENGRAEWARLWYWGQVIRSVPLFLFASVYWATVMIINNLKTVLRTLRSHKGYTILNVVGLSVGIAVTTFALLFVQHEYSFDQDFSKSDQIYRVVQDFNLPSEQGSTAAIGWTIGELLSENFPEITQVTRFTTDSRYTIQHGEKLFSEKTVHSVDPSIFDLFDIAIVSGNSQQPLPNYESIVISESAANLLFGIDDPIGKTVTITEPTIFRSDLTVSAVARDMPTNSHFQFDYLVRVKPKPSDRAAVTGRWGGGYTYIVLPKYSSPEQLEEKLPSFVDDYIGPEVAKSEGSSWEELKNSGRSWTLSLQALTDVHLDNRYEAQYEGALGRSGSRTNITFFLIIALFILILACVNFVNLATARSSSRIKEVGIRKVVGSSRKQLIYQFLVESTVVSLISAAIACALVVVFLGVFNDFLGTEITFDPIGNGYHIAGLVIVALTVGVLAGSYPAFFLSAFRPAELLSGSLHTRRRGVSLRNGLVIFQFFISVLLIVATVVVFNQLSFMQNKDLGFDGERVLVLQNVPNKFMHAESFAWRGLMSERGYTVDDWMSLNRREQAELIEASGGEVDRLFFMTGRRLRVFQQQLLAIPGIQSASFSSVVPGRENGFGINVNSLTTSSGSDIDIRLQFIDSAFFETLQLPLVSGRNVNIGDAAMGAFVINETAAELFGPESPIGSTVEDRLAILEGDAYTPKGFDSPIVGVVKDFQYADMRTAIQPTIFSPFYPNGMPAQILVRLRSGTVSETIAAIERTWNEFIPGDALNYSFLDEDFARLFKAEKQLSKVFGFFSMLAIIIACLGLFGLAAFMAEQRTKEIGIRKTLGASVQSVIQLLSTRFFWLLLIGNGMAWPVGYILMHKWLDNFAYRTEIGAEVFLITAAITLALVIISVGGQALRASLSNPVDSLRYD